MSAKKLKNFQVARPSSTPDIDAAARQFAGQGKTERLSVDAPAGLRKALRQIALERDSTVKAVVLEALIAKYPELAGFQS